MLHGTTVGYQIGMLVEQVLIMQCNAFSAIKLPEQYFYIWYIVLAKHCSQWTLEIDGRMKVNPSQFATFFSSISLQNMYEPRH